MTRFETLTEFAIKFGQNEENIEKFKAIKQSYLQSIGTVKGTNASICIALDNNRFVTKGGWKNGNYSNDEVVGIAVHTPSVSFIVGLTEWMARWTDSSGKIITERHTEAEALQIISGLEDTRKIVEAQNNEKKTAAKLCWNYGYKGLQWYLPSLLELNAMCAYQDEINELIVLVGGTPLSVGYHSSSTEVGPNGSWVVGFFSGTSYGYGKCHADIVRPVTAI